MLSHPDPVAARVLARDAVGPSGGFGPPRRVVPMVWLADPATEHRVPEIVALDPGLAARGLFDLGLARMLGLAFLAGLLLWVGLLVGLGLMLLG